MKCKVLFVGVLFFAIYSHGIVLHRSADIANEILQLKQEIVALQLKANIKDTASTYVRWGRTGCSTNGTTLVYKGYMAGHHYSDNTGGAEFLCLPHDVELAQYGSSYSGDGHLYGTEYEMHFGTGQVNQDAPCCLCKTNLSTSVMIPARTTCFQGWTLEYTGYLAAEQRSRSLTNYVCIDAYPEALDGGGANNNAAVVHNVQVPVWLSSLPTVCRFTTIGMCCMLNLIINNVRLKGENLPF